MEKNTNTVVIALLTLIIGFGAGYALTGDPALQEGMHQMSSGTLMHDSSMDMTNAMGDMMAGLEGKQGDAFDQAFLSEMIVHHQGAVAMAEAALTSAKRAEITQMAQDIISAQTLEIAQMQQWLKAWYGN
jgi:uncharacterized protein (DUF305 family)